MEPETRDAVIDSLESINGKFIAERQRHREALAELRAELESLVARANAEGMSIRAVARSSRISRQRIARMMRRLQVDDE